MRPDRIMLAEIRAGDALDLIQAMTNGREGCLTTVHASYPPIDTLKRLETLAFMSGVELPLARLALVRRRLGRPNRTRRVVPEPWPERTALPSVFCKRSTDSANPRLPDDRQGRWPSSPESLPKPWRTPCLLP